MDDIDLILTLHPHGWSTCVIFVQEEHMSFVITHVFSDPYSDLISALKALKRKEDDVEVFLYDEPGGIKIDIKRKKENEDFLEVRIFEFEEIFCKEPQKYIRKLCFEIKQKQLETIVYLQLKKLFLLLQDKDYGKNRTAYFPFQEFIQFEKKCINADYAIGK